MQDLKVAIVQADLKWEDKPANIAHFNSMFMDLKTGMDVVILPEMFNTGFTMDPVPNAEPMHFETMLWMKKKAKELNAAVVGSLIIVEEKNYYNRLVWMNPDGSCHYYDKKHLFSLAGEHHHYTAGKSKLQVEYKGWKIMPIICYDLRFPAWCRNTDAYDVMIVVANWPQRRIHHWEKLLYARAIENQCYVMATNRIGTDGTGLNYNGMSMAISPMGECLDQVIDHEAVIYTTLQYNNISKIRKELPFLSDRDDFIFHED
jgi:predicted amidohydrolase